MLALTHRFQLSFFYLQEVNTTDNDIELSNLESNALYRVLVCARNSHGTSLPSSMLLINTTDRGMTSESFVFNVHFNVNVSILLVKDADASNYGVPSPPHSLSISAHSATYVTISWNPPEYSHLHEPITYQ